MPDENRWACLECPYETDDYTAIRSHVISEHVPVRDYFTDTGESGDTDD